jgi:hypothetical protein
MGQAKTVVKHSARGSERYNFMVFPDNGRWLWFVTFASTIPTDVPSWGRFLGCGDAPDENDAWKRARRLAAQHRRRP